ncbi:MAG: hypothetical protein LBD30_05950 [Verrucomicrobiales bacterium]|nr:hypothetical protein [Verrucomicrobiales bacterium]
MKKSRNKRQRERLDGMWQVLRASGSPRVDEFAADINRERNFFASFEDFSMR